MLLELNRIRKSFGTVPVLSNVTYSFRAGGRYAVVGPNGSGKSTLLNVISGFTRPDGGTINFHGRNITRRSPGWLARSGVARTFQSVKVFGSLTARENVLIALRNKPDERVTGALLGASAASIPNLLAKANEALQQVGLEDHQGKLAAELSFGQQKLLHFAMVTVNAFDLLLLDEPVAGLEPKFVDVVLTRLMNSAEAIIVVEHSGEFIRRLSPEVLFLANGKIVASGPYDDVMNSPAARESYS
ncbi:MAG: ATP-binding cassette domain-containing protein [Alphaproteobacteria bacterium]|nr:ATP-binding cassette domain-containing protein [Alphaproteobacteria bacterium]